MNPRPVNVEYKSPYKLLITFSNGNGRLFDLQPYLEYPVYNILKDESFCSKAKVKYGTVVWGEEIDFDPDRLFLESKELIQAVD
ncbi:MAG: DUF2442 domain-containing protein [Bacteroidota bacterium]|nr:DUF2442 domain-containing protein [Bacteroidota bacterium]